MEAEILTQVLSSLGGIAALSLGLWYIIFRMRNGHSPDDPAEKYVTKNTFYAKVDEGRKIQDTKHEQTIKAIQDVGTEFREVINQTNQNHLDHVQHHGD